MVEIFNNIRQLYRFLPPCPELAAYVEFYSETSLEDTRQSIHTERFTVKLFPSYTPTIWFNLGAPYLLRNGDKLHWVDKGQDILLLRDQIVERENFPSDNVFTLKFHPGGFEAVLGISQSRLGNGIINAGDVIPPMLIKRMKAMDCFEQRVSLLQGFLLDSLAKVSAKDNASHLHDIKLATEAFYNADMGHKNSELASRLYLTDKTFYRRFNAVIGTSPKNYFSMLRIRKALTAYITDKSSFSAYNFGYYDLSHFYKLAEKFLGGKISAHK